MCSTTSSDSVRPPLQSPWWRAHSRSLPGTAISVLHRHTKKELIGSPKSTYFELAAYLGKDDMQLVRSYQYITPQLQERGASYQTFQKVVGKDWNHPLLRKRIRFLEYYKIDEETNEIGENTATNHTDIDTNQTRYRIRRRH